MSKKRRRGSDAADYVAELKRDIQEFKATGKLPQERDLAPNGRGAGGVSSYWEYVDLMADGVEPLWNTGDTEVGESIVSTHRRLKFTAWLRFEFPKLVRADQELFKLAFVEERGQKELARFFGWSQSTISAKLEELKRDIATYIGL